MTLRDKVIRLAHERPDLRSRLLVALTERTAGKGIRNSDLPGFEDLNDAFRRISKVWSSEGDAESGLRRVLTQHGLREAYRGSGLGRDGQQVFLQTEDGFPVEDPLNVFYRPGPRPGWTAFQVSW